MKKGILSKMMLTLLVVSAFATVLAHAGGTTGISEGWMRGGCDMAGTRYYPFPSKYHVPDKPFETLWTSPHEGKLLQALTGDVNGDGKLEVVKVSGDNLRVISGGGAVLWTETIPGDDSHFGTGWLHLNMLEDVTGDSVPEIFVSRKVSDTIQNIYVYDGNQNRIKTLSRTVASDGLMTAAAVFDVDKDGDKEIFCNIGSNFDGNPRGSCLFDYDTGAHLWYYAAGNAIGSCMADLNNDGVLEITGSAWYTVHNGASGYGKGSDTYTDDSSIYVVVVNENGDEILTKQLHGVHNHGTAYAKIVDLDGDGTKEIIIFHQHWALTYPGFAEIFLWDSNGNELKSYQGPYNGVWSGPVVADINKDGKDEVIVREKLGGALLVLDYNLSIIDSAAGYVARFANDLNGDDELEIICGVVGTEELAVLDNNLDELWRLPFGGGAIASDVTGDGVNDIILTDSDGLRVVSFPGLDATVDVDPDTLNLKSDGEWLTAYIELPMNYDVANIDVLSVLLNDTITVDPDAPATIGDYDDDGISDLMLKFSRFDVQNYIIATLGTPERFTLVTLTISGNLNEGIHFQGSEMIRVISARSGGLAQHALLR
jgi:hypothetical protein